MERRISRESLRHAHDLLYLAKGNIQRIENSIGLLGIDDLMLVAKAHDSLYLVSKRVERRLAQEARK